MIERHVRIQNVVTSVAHAVLSLPDGELEAFIGRNEHSLELGPILDPTLFRAAVGSLAQLTAAARAVLVLRDTLEDLVDDAIFDTTGGD